METIHSKANSHRKSSVSRIQRDKIGWTKDETDAFGPPKSSLANQVTLAHRDVNRGLCVFTDASTLLWSHMVTQVSPEELRKPYVDQRHESLCFLSGQFTGSSFGWSILEKKASAIMLTVEHMH